MTSRSEGFNQEDSWVYLEIQFLAKGRRPQCSRQAPTPMIYQGYAQTETAALCIKAYSPSKGELPNDSRADNGQRVQRSDK